MKSIILAAACAAVLSTVAHANPVTLDEDQFDVVISSPGHTAGNPGGGGSTAGPPGGTITCCFTPPNTIDGPPVTLPMPIDPAPIPGPWAVIPN